ncbi:MAG: hypothetical protein H6Q33_4454 [Deltaproteobacteria bacterium]|nr:hypothetical protein [Deltaproteobacteria bacterium]
MANGLGLDRCQFDCTRGTGPLVSDCMYPDNRRRHRHQQDRHEPASAQSSTRPPQPSGLAQRHGIEPFALFCAYHLGITEDGGYRFQNIHQVAKRFGTNAAVIRQLLAEFEMDSDTVVHSAFDMAGAQVDIMLAPEGINRTEVARDLFTQFRAAPRRSRNWAKELEEDARENERTFGPTRR